MNSNTKQIPLTISDCDTSPKFWDDDLKMEAWFSSFRNRDLNPLNFDNKMAFWKDNVELFCLKTNNCYFSLQQLKLFFARGSKMPCCLGTVIETMIKDGTIQNVSEFENMLSNNTWVGWTVNTLVSSPFKWSLKKMKDVVSPAPIEIDDNTEFIHVEALKKQSEDLHKCINNESDQSVMTYEAIVEKYSEKLGIRVDFRTVKLMVHYLELNGKAKIIFEKKHCNVHLIKFSINDQRVIPITETEISIHVLGMKEKLLVQKLQTLECEKESIHNEVKDFLNLKRRNLAKNALRKQKELEKRINKLTNVLENIQNLLYRVQDTEADTQILESYRVGADALKSKINNKNLNLDKVDNAMDEIEKVLDIHNDIQETLGQTVGPIQIEAELEDELATLLLDNIPGVPPQPPSPGRKSKDFNVDDLPLVPNQYSDSVKGFKRVQI